MYIATSENVDTLRDTAGTINRAFPSYARASPKNGRADSQTPMEGVWKEHGGDTTRESKAITIKTTVEENRRV